MNNDVERKVAVVERREIPWLSLILGYGPTLPMLFGSALAWLSDGETARTGQAPLFFARLRPTQMLIAVVALAALLLNAALNE